MKTALVPAPPQGLYVQVEDIASDGGPYRQGGMTRTVVSMDVDRDWPIVRGTDLLLLAGSCGLLCWLLLTALWVPALLTGFLSLGVLAMRPVSTQRRAGTARLLTIETDSLRLLNDEQVALATVEDLDVRERRLPSRTVLHVHDVVASTRTGDVVIATTFDADQADHVRFLVETALAGREERDE
jgi:hypothetical protein